MNGSLSTADTLVTLLDRGVVIALYMTLILSLTAASLVIVTFGIRYAIGSRRGRD